MAIEKSWRAVTPRLLTLDGTSGGLVTLATTRNLYVKQNVILQQGSDSLHLEVKDIISKTELRVGPRNGSIESFSDLSSMLQGQAFLYAEKQPRPAIPEKEYNRATFAEEPIVAKRSILVDEQGNYYSEDNPLPTSGNSSSATKYDKILITRDADKDITQAVYQKNGVALKTLDLIYDADKDLIEVDINE